MTLFRSSSIDNYSGTLASIASKPLGAGFCGLGTPSELLPLTVYRFHPSLHGPLVIASGCCYDCH